MGLAPVCVVAWFFVPAFRILAVSLAAIFVLIGIVLIICRVNRRKREGVDLMAVVSETPSSPKPTAGSVSDMLRNLDWFQFEKLVAAIYENKGYKVQRLGGANPDGGMDLLIQKDGLKSVVQCKHWKSWDVGVRNIREFLGTLTDQKISNGIFITLKGYTADAKELAAKHNLTLLEESDVMALMEDVCWKFNPVILSILHDTRKICPKCERQMVLRTASRGPNAGGQFWGCSGYPRCRFILKCM